MIPRRWPGRDRGSFTAEFAAGLPALMLLLLAGLTAVDAVTTRAQCVDAAREGAIAAARGESGTEAAARVAPQKSTLDVRTGADVVTVTVTTRVRVLGGGLPGLTVQAIAVAAREPDPGIPPGTQTGPAEIP
ncbi:TadE family type IV pilus minor pilin [Krasilnikovia sp. MM14-A1004]|uniref:TadE family type IV pilus minor pilin n=1 Tax=Krasilnikovia sp. MM14-A1004 TaxID=3373541 RepID=UPI00399CA339